MELQQLEEENRELKMQLKVGKEEMAVQATADSEERVLATKQLSAAILRGDDEEIKSLLKSFVLKFFPYGSDRSDIMKKHLEQLERLLKPGQVTKMCMYCLCQDDPEFFNPARPDSLWNILLRELDISSEQRDEIRGFKQNAQNLTRGLRFTEVELKTLKERIRRKDEALAEEMRELQDVLSPQQFAKFIVWCAENPINTPNNEYSKNVSSTSSTTAMTTTTSSTL
jgi:hypothetical protein